MLKAVRRSWRNNPLRHFDGVGPGESTCYRSRRLYFRSLKGVWVQLSHCRWDRHNVGGLPLRMGMGMGPMDGRSCTGGKKGMDGQPMAPE
jgi:hypothetical protein